MTVQKILLPPTHFSASFQLMFACIFDCVISISAPHSCQMSTKTKGSEQPYLSIFHSIGDHEICSSEFSTQDEIAFLSPQGAFKHTQAICHLAFYNGQNLQAQGGNVSGAADALGSRAVEDAHRAYTQPMYVIHGPNKATSQGSLGPMSVLARPNAGQKKQ